MKRKDLEKILNDNPGKTIYSFAGTNLPGLSVCLHVSRTRALRAAKLVKEVKVQRYSEARPDLQGRYAVIPDDVHVFLYFE